MPHQYFCQCNPGDRKVRFVINRNVPWINTRYDFFRLNETTMKYDSIGTTNRLNFVDEGLVNGKQYCYYVRSTGGYLTTRYAQEPDKFFAGNMCYTC